MESFLFLFFKLFPFYILLFVGYFAAKKLKFDLETIAKIHLYIFSPPVIFYGVLQLPPSSNEMYLPVVFYIISSVISLVFLFIGKLFWKDSMPNLLGFTAGTGNVGNIGIPLSITLFGLSATGPAVMITVGTSLFINTLGFFIASNGKYGAFESIKKLVKLPLIWAFIAGITAHFIGLSLANTTLSQILETFVHGYNLIGFILIGVGIASIKKESLDIAYLWLSHIAKFIVWPLVALAFISFDTQWLHLFGDLTHNVILIQSVTPIALLVISISSVLKLHPEKASLAVLISTLFALFYIPLMAAIFIK